MKLFLPFFILLAFTGKIFAQAPVNDNCSGLIDLGLLPACPSTIYSNVNATASNIGFGNNPSCFNGGAAQRDVWFSFTTSDTLFDITISLTGVLNGPNADAIGNPEIALYRGDCEFNGLAEIACISSPNGSTQVVLDVLGLTPNVTYYIRVNDYSPTASPNSGDFILCITEFVPAFNMGDAPGTTSCFGTLYDSGGPTGNYQNNENHTFTICPADFHQCIEISILDYNTEINFDRLNVFNGNTTSAPLIGTITGVNPVTQPFVIQATTSGCVTLQFISDGSAVGPGFELTWACSPLACGGSSFDNPVVINALPFSQTGVTTCTDASNFNQSPCGNDAFLNGPEVVYVYNSPGGLCAGIQVTGANAGTGVLVLNGPPNDPNTICVAVNAGGTINSADFRTPGLYYIVVADGNGCTPYNITITPTECELPAGLVNALCNPLNGCIEEGGVPSVFNFQDGFQDMELIAGLNSGCFPTNGVGAEADFYWFTIQAEADGPFGFILAGAGPPSDIDFNVWGPFSQTQVCETPGVVINAVTNTQPIRSSWTGGNQPTGLADIHPVTGITVLDDYDCGSPATPGAGGDRFVRTIPALEGQVFVILVNDFGNQIGTEGISVDWSPSNPAVLAPVPPVVAVADTTICLGASVQLSVTSAVANVTWVDPDGTLSCTNCPNPIATPNATTIYTALIDAVCYDETVPVKITVFDVQAGPDLTVCLNEVIQIVAGTEYENAVYNWTAPAGITFSCTDCPDPLVQADAPGTFPLTVQLLNPNCILEDVMILTVLPQAAPQFTVSDDLEICIGETVNIGGPATPGVSYSWSSVPGGFASGEADPSVSPTQTITYFLSATNAECPLSSFDSVKVTVFLIPELIVATDTAVCQGSTIILGSSNAEANVVYTWTGPDVITDPSDPNSTASPQSAGTYTLNAVRGACEVEASFEVTITPIDIQILNPDTIRICQGEVIDLQVSITPSDSQAVWTPNFGLSSNIGNSVQATPQNNVTYTATVSVPGCIKTDIIVVEVDTLPTFRQITADPVKDPYCPGETVVLSSPVYEPSDFPGIRFTWFGPGFETPDTLWNMVITTQDTATYFRVVSNRGCVDTTEITLNVFTPPNPRVIPSDTVLCFGQSVQLLAVDFEGYDLSWTPEEGLSCTDCPNPIATPGSTTVYTLMVDSQPCPVGASANIIVLPGPTVDIAPNQTICVGGTAQLNFASDPQSTYLWTSSTDPNFTSSTPELVVSPLTTSTYTLQASRGGCAPIVFMVTVTVIIPSTADAGPDQTICEGSNATLAGVLGGGATSGTWSTATGGSFSPNANTLNATFTPPGAGTFALLLTATDPAGVCPSAIDEVLITVNPAAIVDAGADRMICAGDTIHLEGSFNDVVSSAVWSASVPGGIFNPNANTLNAVYTPPAGFTSITLTLLSNDPAGPCPAASDEMVIAITPLAFVNAGPDVTVCAGTATTLNAAATPTDPDGGFQWFIVGNNTPIGNSASLVVNTDAPGTVRYATIYNYGPGCAPVRDTVNVTVVSSIPITSLTADTTEVIIGNAVTLTVTTDPPAPAGATYTWTLPDGSTQTGQAVFTHIPVPEFPGDETRVTVRYSVTVTSPEGCPSTQFIDIVVFKPDIQFPNVFTPNGDNLNDLFRPVPGDALATLIIEDFKVFNRWGQVVYNGRDNNNQGWDGTHGGKPAVSDVYVWRVVFRYPGTERLDKSGDLTLIR